MIEVTTQSRINISYKTIYNPNIKKEVSGWQFTIERKHLSNVVSELYNTLDFCITDLNKIINEAQ